MVIGHLSFAQAAYPQRIISGMPSITEMLFALNLDDRVVGVTTNCNYPLAARTKEKIGGFFLNLEKVVSLKPDLVIMLEEAQRRDFEKFRAYGLKVFSLNPRNINEVLESLVAIGKVTGREERARALVYELRSRLERVRPKVGSIRSVLRLPRVVVIVGSNPLIVAGRETFINDIILFAGGDNIAKDANGAYPQYSLEKLLKEDPECIIIPKGIIRREEFIRDSRWQKLGAVKNNRLFFIEPDIISRPGPRVVEAVERIAKFLYASKAKY